MCERKSRKDDAEKKVDLREIIERALEKKLISILYILAVGRRCANKKLAIVQLPIARKRNQIAIESVFTENYQVTHYTDCPHFQRNTENRIGNVFLAC